MFVISFCYSRPSSTDDSSIDFKATEGHVVGSGAVLAHLNDTEVPEAIETNFSVNVGVYAPG